MTQIYRAKLRTGDLFFVDSTEPECLFVLLVNFDEQKIKKKSKFERSKTTKNAKMTTGHQKNKQPFRFS